MVHHSHQNVRCLTQSYTLVQPIYPWNTFLLLSQLCLGLPALIPYPIIIRIPCACCMSSSRQYSGFNCTKTLREEKRLRKLAHFLVSSFLLAHIMSSSRFFATPTPVVFQVRRFIAVFTTARPWTL